MGGVVMRNAQSDPEIIRDRLQELLTTVRRIDEQLSEPLTLNDSIAELEQTLALYEWLDQQDE